MKKLVQQIIVIFFICFFTLQIKAQNIGIGTATPHASAMLDISDTAKGILIPRITQQQRNSIASPAKGLMIFVSTDSSFYFFDGNWKRIAVANEGWNTNGNISIGSTNFIGTTNAQPLRFRVNNLSAGEINFVNDNISFGFQSLQANLTGHSITAIGSKALFKNTTGSGNTAVGKEALFQNTTGSSNTAIGATSLNNNSTGSSNIAVGNATLFRNTIGSDNTAIGEYSLNANSIGSSNIAIGNKTLFHNTTGLNNTANGYMALGGNFTGNQNTAVGSSALNFNTIGSANTAIGNDAINKNTSGTHNTAVGFNAMRNNTTGVFNTVIGAFAEVTSGNLTNATAIGTGAFSNASNKVRIGNAGVTIIEGQVPFTIPSDGRFKTNVKENVSGIDFIMQLRPVTYYFKTSMYDGFLNKSAKSDLLKLNYTESENILHTGFIAQEVEQAANKVGFKFDGLLTPKNKNETYSLSYSQFVVPLVKAVQEQQKIMEEQQKKIIEQQKKTKEQQKKIERLEKIMEAIKK
jgi:trimeric autotransporter adhesin